MGKDTENKLTITIDCPIRRYYLLLARYNSWHEGWVTEKMREEEENTGHNVRKNPSGHNFVVFWP